MAFDAGAVVGRLELGLASWKQSVEKVKTDLAAMAKESGLSTKQFSDLKGVLSGVGATLKTELEAKLKGAEAALVAFKNTGQLTAEGEKKLQTHIENLKNELAGMTTETGKADKSQQSLWKQFAIGEIFVAALRKTYAVLSGLIKDSVGNAIEAEQAENRLRIALESTGRTTSAMLPDLVEYSKALQSQTTYDDEAALGAMTLLTQLTNLNSQGIQGATRGAMGLATVMGVDLQTATQKLIPFINGQTDSLRGTGIEIDKSLKGEERQAEILKRLAVLYQQASGETQTFGGRMKQLGNLADEVKESFGNALVKNEKFNEFLGDLKDKIVSLIESGKIEEWANLAAKAIEGVAGAFEWVLKIIDKLRAGEGEQIFILAGDEAKTAVAEIKPFIASLKVMGTTYNDLILTALNPGKRGWEETKARIKAADDALVANKDNIPKWVEKALEFIGVNTTLTEGVNETGTALGNNEAALEAARKAAEKYTAFLNSVGIETLAQQREKLDNATKAQKDLNAMLAAGKISLENYREANFTLNEILSAGTEQGILFNAFLRVSETVIENAIDPTQSFAEEMDRLTAELLENIQKTQAAHFAIDDFGMSVKISKDKLLAYEAILKELGVQTLNQVKVATRDVFQQQRLLTELYHASILSGTEYTEAMKALEERLRSMGGYIEKEAPKQLSAFAQAWADMITNIAQGWSAAFVDMFGLTEALIGEATQHNQEYFDQCIADINRDYDANKSILEQKLSDLDDYYSAAMEEVDSYYDNLVDQANDAYDASRKLEDRAYDAQELKIRRAEEDEDIRYSRQYDRERQAIENSKLSGKAKDAALLALEIKYENEKLARERAREDAKIAREIAHEARLEALAKAREDRLEALALAREAREKQLDLEKEARQRALQLELLALAEKHEADLEAIRKADELSQKTHDAAQLARQNSLWGKIKTVFGDAIEGMLTAWVTGFVTKFLKSITEKILPGMKDIGDKGVEAGTTAGNALAGIGTAIEGIVKAILDVIEDIANTVVDIVAYAITTLAEAIATAATSLAAAAPALLTVGAVALLLYAGFQAINELIGGGGGGSGDGMGRVVERQDRFLAVWDWWAPQVASLLTALEVHLVDIFERIGDFFPKIDNLASCINTQGGNICAAIAGIPGAATGALVMGPSLINVGENAPRIPEVILPLPELGAFARGMASAGAGASGGAGAGQQVFVFKPIVIDKGDKWMIQFVKDTVQGKLNHRDIMVPVSAIGG